MKQLIIMLGIMSLALSGCATPIAHQLIRALPQSPDNDTGTVIIIRPSDLLSASLLADNVIINDYTVDYITNGIYKEYKLPSGNYAVLLTASTGFGSFSSNTLHLILEKGEIKYLAIRHIDAFMGRSINLYEISENEAKDLMKKIKKGSVKYTSDKYPELPLSTDKNNR